MKWREARESESTSPLTWGTEPEGDGGRNPRCCFGPNIHGPAETYELVEQQWEAMTYIPNPAHAVSRSRRRGPSIWWSSTTSIMRRISS